jgi:hypothetical protein
VHVVHGQHGHELQPVGAVLAELVDPVVVRLAQGERELGIHVVAGDEAQAARRVEHRDVHAFLLHAHDLRLGVVIALDGEVQPACVGQPRPGEGLGALGRSAPDALPVLLQVGVRGGQPVDEGEAGGAPKRAAVRAHGHADAMLELRVQIPIEEIGRLHDVHVGVDEAQSVFHLTLLGVAGT